MMANAFNFSSQEGGQMTVVNARPAWAIQQEPIDKRQAAEEMTQGVKCQCLTAILVPTRGKGGKIQRPSSLECEAVNDRDPASNKMETKQLSSDLYMNTLTHIPASPTPCLSLTQLARKTIKMNNFLQLGVGGACL